MITYCTGDLFDAQTEAIVNTVNTVGVMGKGIAAALHARWVLLVSLVRSDSVELELFDGSGVKKGCARVEVTPKGLRSDELATAVRSLLRGECPTPLAAAATRVSDVATR